MNSANFLPGPIAPGEIVTIFGDGLGPDQAVFYQVVNDQFTTSLAGVRILFNGEAAPMVGAVRGQASAIVPYSVLNGPVSVQAEYLGQRTPALLVPFAVTSPAIFSLNESGRGQGAVLNQDNSVNGPDRRAAKGSVIQIFATGEGQTEPSGISGLLAVGDVLPKPLAQVSVTIGGIPATLQYWGAAPGLVAGVIQVNAYVPLNVASGSSIPITLQFGAATAPPGITVAIQ